MFAWKLSVGWFNGYVDYDIADTGDIYIIDYSAVKSALEDSTLLNYLSNIDNYTPSSAFALLQAYDDLTSQSYLFDSVSKDNVVSLAETLNTKVNALENSELISNLVAKADDAEISQLVTENQDFHDSVQITDNGAVIPNTDESLYTNSSWIAYDKAFTALQRYYASLDPFGENEPYTDDQIDLDRMRDNLSNALNQLVERADYTSVDNVAAEDSQYTSAYIGGNGTSYQNQTYSWYTWADFADNYAIAANWASTDSSLRADTEKYNIDWAVKEFGPYVGYDANGNIVTSDTQTPVWYVFFENFYESADATEPSRFMEGDYVLVDGALV
ncbi:MAG: hypothetical protein LIO43_02500 [Clostridiales bacterium]|nr:hypothetical protein [Clostridiales bacterium]